MSILAWIVLGLLAGFIGSKIVNKSGEGLLLDIVLGIVGAVVGGWLFNKFGHSGVTGIEFVQPAGRRDRRRRRARRVARDQTHLSSSVASYRIRRDSHRRTQSAELNKSAFTVELNGVRTIAAAVAATRAQNIRTRAASPYARAACDRSCRSASDTARTFPRSRLPLR